jgi:hypothetical protein
VVEEDFIWDILERWFCCYFRFMDRFGHDGVCVMSSVEVVMTGRLQAMCSPTAVVKI